MSDLQTEWDRLPIEVIWNIALRIESVKDLGAFSESCVHFFTALNGDDFSFWRIIFQDNFDTPDEWSALNTITMNLMSREVYRHRCLTLEQSLVFRRQGDHAECHPHIIGIMVEACWRRPKSNNARVLEEMISKWNIMDLASHAEPVRVPLKGLRHNAIVLTLFHLSVRRSQRPLIYKDHRVAQSFSYRRALPILLSPSNHETIHFPCLAGLASIFLEHIAQPFHPVQQCYSNLREAEQPRGWQSRLQDGTRTLGRLWKGTYSYLSREDDAKFHSGQTDQYLEDRFAEEDHLDRFQDYHFECITKRERIFWPPTFSSMDGMDLINHPSSEARCRPMHFRVIGPRAQGPDFEARGWVQGLPSQLGIPGWQKLVMVSFTRAPDGETISTDDTWAYEGVLLPGSQVLLGRWWRPDDGRPRDQASLAGSHDEWGVSVDCGR